MENHKFFRNIVVVVTSNAMKLVAGLFVTFLIPIVFTVTDYGYLKVFLLYASYTTVLHLGFNDGIYLKYGGFKYNDLDAKLFRKYTIFLMITQIVIALILLFSSFVVSNKDTRIIIIFISLNLLPVNLSAYFMVISQVTSRFKDFAFRNFVYSILMIAIVIVIYMLHIDNYFYYLVPYTLVNLLLFFLYILKYKDLVFGQRISLRQDNSDIKKIYEFGIPLLIANFITVIIINISRQMVEFFYNVEVFAVFAFAYSMLNLTNIFVTSVGTVLYPKLIEMGRQKTQEIYHSLVVLIMVIAFLSLSTYFPLEYIVVHYISKYAGSILILKIIFPGLTITAVIQIVKNNYFKTYKLTKLYIISGLITLVFSVIANMVAILYFKTITSIAIASVLSLMIWYIVSDLMLRKYLNIDLAKPLFYFVLNASLFYFLVFLDYDLFSKFIIYIVLTLCISILLFRKKIIESIEVITKRKIKN